MMQDDTDVILNIFKYLGLDFSGHNATKKGL